MSGVTANQRNRLRDEVAHGDWYKPDTAQAFESAYASLLAHGYSDDDAIALLSSLRGAVANEYGE